MPSMRPEDALKRLPRRAVVMGLPLSLPVLGLGLGCFRRLPEPPHWETFSTDLPRAVAGAVPYEPERLRGRAVLVTFVATWCFPCLAELVVLQRLERDYGSRGLSQVLVGMDLDGERVLTPFAQMYQLPWPLIVADERLREGQTAFGRIRELPSRWLFDRSGKPVLAYSGVVPYETLAEVVERHLD